MLLDHKSHGSRIEGTVEEGVTLEGRIVIEKHTVIKKGCIIRGPVYIGSNCTIGPDTYIGPYTSVGNNCCLVGVEVENSVLMDSVVLENIGKRITNSIIGSEARVRKRSKRPYGIKLIIGERAIIEI